MSLLAALLAGVVAAQGEAIEIRYPAERGVAAIELSWNGRRVPLAPSGDAWTAIIGVDLDESPGRRSVDLTIHYEDGRRSIDSLPLDIEPKDFPVTRLTVEPKYVELSPEDQARATRESREIGAIYDTVQAERYWTEAFRAPLPGVVGGRNFGHRRVFNDQPRAPHSGADLKAAVGDAVYASNRGRVVLAKELFFSGNAVFIDHGNGVYSTYLHLSEILVQPGDWVDRGQVIGRAGATGRVTGPHLHWGVRVLGARVDPFSLLNLPGRSE